MPRSDWNTLTTFKVLLPPLLQQQAIATVLSDIDSLITSLKQLIAKKRDIKQAHAAAAYWQATSPWI